MIDVSRETKEQLQEFANLLLKWNKAINLIAKSTKNDVFERHIMDGYQIVEHVEFKNTWLDLGSGGGLPGIVLAIAAKQQGADTQFTLVESDQRKCTFLRTAAIELGLNVDVVTKRIEAHSQAPADHISARALCSLDQLLAYSKPFMHDETICVFPKGEKHHSEVLEAQKMWTFDVELVKSCTQASAAIVMVRNLK